MGEATYRPYNQNIHRGFFLGHPRGIYSRFPANMLGLLLLALAWFFNRDGFMRHRATMGAQKVGWGRTLGSLVMAFRVFKERVL